MNELRKIRSDAEAMHPTHGAVMLEPRTVLALLDVAEAAQGLSFPSNPVGEFTVDGFAGARLKSYLDALDRLT